MGPILGVRGEIMGYVGNEKRRAWLLLGAGAMLLCGISDCLLSFMGEGEPWAVKGIVGMDIARVPLWYYQLSFIIGIIASPGYYLGARAVRGYCLDRLGDVSSKALRAYTIGTVMMSLGIFGIHSICCLALMNVRGAVLSGVSPGDIEKYFVPASLHPFIIGTAWQTIADLISGTAFIILVLRGTINVRRGWIAVGPLCFYVICQILGKGLSALTGLGMFRHWLAGGESWGIGSMFLAVFFACGKGAPAGSEK